MLATPGLPDGSWSALPRKANSTAIKGSVRSRTSQASMPPGLTTRSMVMARAAGAARNSTAPATSAMSARVPAQATEAVTVTSVSPRRECP
jgi:hypothetical protein